jgi:hypothetical protein
MQAFKTRFNYLFLSTRGLTLVAIAVVALITAIWGTLSGPMVEWGVKDITVNLLNMDLVQVEREGRIIMLYHTIAMTIIASMPKNESNFANFILIFSPIEPG